MWLVMWPEAGRHIPPREPVDAGVLQVNVESHTGADGFTRLARQAEFAEAIQAGCDYVLVDDFVGGVFDRQAALRQTETDAAASAGIESKTWNNPT